VWRQALAGVKEGASVLAYARLPAAAGGPAAANAPVAAEAERRLSRERALLAVQSYGAGRVALLNFDGTWRLRYRKGDDYHHKFWGQLLRWGVGEKLRSGTARVRVGTDRLTYPADAPVQVAARIFSSTFAAVKDDHIFFNVYRGPERVLRKQMTPRRGAPGRYDGTLPPLPTPGRYRVELEGAEIAAALAADHAPPVSTEFLVAAQQNAPEMRELTADLEMPRKIAQASGGLAVTAEAAGSVLDRFGAGNRTLTEHVEIALWDSWPALVVILLLATAEWVARRRSGMA